MVSKVEFETIDTRSLELESIISHMTIIFEVRTIYRLQNTYYKIPEKFPILFETGFEIFTKSVYDQQVKLGTSHSVSNTSSKNLLFFP